MPEHVRPNVLYKRMKVAERRYQILRAELVEALDKSGSFVHVSILREALQKAADVPKEAVVPRRIRDTLNTPPTQTSTR